MEELFAAVTQRAQGTPYEVVRTDKGFDVRLNLADARFFGLLSEQQVQKVFVHHVRLKDAAAKTFTVVDQFTEMSWRAGIDGRMVPAATGKFQTITGKSYSKGMEKQWARRPDGTFGKVVDYTFDSGEGHGLIKAAAESAGWTEKLNGYAKGGLYAAIGAGVFVVLLMPTLALIIHYSKK